MILGSETSTIDAALPPWAQGLTVAGLLTLIVLAFLRDWVITAKRHERELELERRVCGIHEENARRATENNDKLIAALDPLLKGNEAILRIVTEVQDAQEAARRRAPR